MFSLIKKIVKGLQGPQINTKNPLHGQELKSVLVSAMYASQQSAYLNSYETGLDNSTKKEILRNWWSISDRDTALETMDYLANSGFIHLLPAVLEAYQNQNGDYASIIENNAQNEEDYERMVNMFRNLKLSYPHYVEEKIITSINDIEKIGISGWDYGRGAFIARLCWEENYISKEELVSYLDFVYHQLKSHCNTWKDYTDSYIIGRGMWNAESANAGMVAIANELLTHEKSPIKGGGAI